MQAMVNEIEIVNNIKYDESVYRIIPAYESIYELSHHLLCDNLEKEAKILVAGVGTGKEIINFSRNNSNWSFTGFDPEEPMLKIARKKILKASLQNKISLVNGLIDDVTEKEFDAATSILVMHFLPNDRAKLNFLKGIADKLKSGSLLILVGVEGEIGSNEFNTFNSAWRNQQIFKRADSYLVNEEFALRENDFHFTPQKQIESLLSEAGFINIDKFFKAYLFGGYVAVKK